MAEEPTEITENEPTVESDDQVAAAEAAEPEPESRTAPPAQEEEAAPQEEVAEEPTPAEAKSDEKGDQEAGEAAAEPEQPAEAANEDEAATEDVQPKAEDGEVVGAAVAADAAGEGETKAEGEPSADAGDAAEAGTGDQQPSDEAPVAAAAEGEAPEAAEGEATEAAEGEGPAAAEGEGPAAAEGEAPAAADGEAPAAAEGEEGADSGETVPATADGEGEGKGEEATATGDAGEAGGEEAAAAEATDEGKAEAAGGDEGEQPPTSETFADGERTESPARASEKLSREPTPTAEERQRADRIDEVDEEAERPEPTSPDEMVAAFDEIGIEGEEGEEEEEEEEYEEEEVVEEEFNREHMIASYKQAMQDREQKLHQNSLLQTRLSDYFRRKKADQGGQAEASQETEKSITDQEQRYAKFVYNLDELRHTRDAKRLEFDDRIQELELECQSREEEVRLLFQGQLDAKRKIGLKAVSATNGRPFPAVTQKRPEATGGGKAQDPLSTSVDDMLQDEAALEDQVARVRLDNIGLSNRVRKCETSLKAKEELSEGLHMIDFEQLKIENQTYNEKIEERQEELLKLKKKITNNVQVLTHLKEKLQFVQCKKQEQCESLDELDQTLAKRRDLLTRTKQTRDSLRNDNQRLKQNSGLLGNEALLRNFEENADLVTEKRGRLDSLKTQHSEATLQCNKLKRKIDVARAQSAQ